MSLAERQARLIRERQQVREMIDAAYWNFTRQARAKPPSMVVPEAYTRLREINAELHEIAVAQQGAI